MSHAEFVAWVVFAGHEPLPARRADQQTAMLMTLLATIHRQKGRKPFKISQFLPDWWNEKASPQRLMQKLRGLTMGLGSAVDEGEEHGGTVANGEHPGDIGRQNRRRGG